MEFLNLIKGKENIVINVEKEDIDRLIKEYEQNIFNCLREQIDYSNSHNDYYRLIDKKSSRRLLAKKFTSIRKLNIVPVIYLNEKGFLKITYGTVIWKNRIFFSIAGLDYWKYIKNYQPVTYPDGFTENCYICCYNIPYTITLSSLYELVENKDVKKLLEHAELTMFSMNEEKMNYELTGFFKSGQNILLLIVIGFIVGGFCALPIGFIIGRIIH